MFGAQSAAFTFLENRARDIFGRYGYEELRTPILEHTELFCRSIGEQTDVVQKEMYTFPDRKDRSLTMRPEATAGVVRAYIESGRAKEGGVNKLFTCGPMFRYERPQKGRMRQFHQLNCECFGAAEPALDAEVISMLMHFLRDIGITDVKLLINSLGCEKCRPAYRTALYDYLRSLDPSALCEDCRRRMEINPLRVLDCKVQTCIDHTINAPRILDHNCPECAAHFAGVRDFLAMAEVDYVINHKLVRGLDYYCRTTFEVVSNAVGSQDSIAGGGRYDGLIRQLGGPDSPAFGFACGMERLALLLKENVEKRLDFFIVAMDGDKNAEVGKSAFRIADQLRKNGLGGEIAQPGGFKGKMRQAGKSGARFCLIIGPDELAAGIVSVKNMDSGEQFSKSSASTADLVNAIS